MTSLGILSAGLFPGCCAADAKGKIRIRVATKIVTTFLFIAFPNPQSKISNLKPVLPRPELRPRVIQAEGPKISRGTS